MFSFRSKIDSNLKYYMENKVYRKYRVLIKCKNFTKEIAKKMSEDYEQLKVISWKECKDIIDNLDQP